MANGPISAGPPPLTEGAADAALDVIDFMAAAVRGVDTIDVTPAVRIRHEHLAAYYPMLNPVDRFWFANAPFTLAAIQTEWTQLNELQQNMYRQAWAMSLPAMMQLVDPVLQAADPAAQPLGAELGRRAGRHAGRRAAAAPARGGAGRRRDGCPGRAVQPLGEPPDADQHVQHRSEQHDWPDAGLQPNVLRASCAPMRFGSRSPSDP
jgi:hypothetical protein